MKSIYVNYHIFSEKVEKKEKIVLISDAHDIFTKSKIQYQLISDINKLGAHHVSIAGDTMQGVKYENNKKCAELSYFLDGLAEAQPVVLSLGNHDLVGLTKKGRQNFRDLGNFENIYPLDNQSVIIDNFRITGFSSDRDAYAPANHASGRANELYTNDWNSSGIDIKTDSDFFEELVGHAPHPLASRYVGENAKGIRNFDIYLTGHLHNGYVPCWYKGKGIEKLADKGIWEMPVEKDLNGKMIKVRPWVYTKTDLCRGLHYISNEGSMGMQLGNSDINYIDDIGYDKTKTVPLVISGGVNKFFGLPSSPEITVIDIYPKDKTLVKTK